MKLEKTKMHFETYRMHFEEKDDYYNLCRYATIFIDYDELLFRAETAVGDFSYQWQDVGDCFKTFLKNLNKDYFLNKISNRNKVLFRKSVNDTVKKVFDYYDTAFSAETLAEIKESLDDLEYTDNEELLYFKLENTLLRYDITETFDIICIQKGYPQNANIFADIFIDVFLKILDINFEE